MICDRCSFQLSFQNTSVSPITSILIFPLVIFISNSNDTIHVKESIMLVHPEIFLKFKCPKINLTMSVSDICKY